VWFSNVYRNSSVQKKGNVERRKLALAPPRERSTIEIEKNGLQGGTYVRKPNRRREKAEKEEA